MRSYGVTNAAPYATAPPVGASGDTYWNTALKTLYVSDGVQWIPWPSSGATSLDSGWHYFDAFGEPVLSPNRYDPSGKTWPPGRFRRDAAGCVFIEAMMSGILGPYPVVLFTLPPGFRPAFNTLLACPMGVSGQGVVQIAPTGVVSVIAGSATSTWLQISKTFMADDAQTINWVEMTPLGSSWVAWAGAGQRPPSYFIDDVGDVHFAGGMTGGGVAGGAIFYTLPSDIWPSGQLIFSQCAGPWGAMGAAQHARVDIKSDGGMYVAGFTGGGTNAFVSLDGMVLYNPKGYWFVPALINAWVAYGAQFAPPAFTVNKNGVLALRGLMKGGTITAPTVIVAANGIPEPPMYQVAALVGANGNGMSRIDAVTDGSLQVVGFFNGGGNGYTSWCGNQFFVRAEGG